MSLAERTRAAVRRHPFLLEGLRAGVLNYAAAARFLDVGDHDAVVAALRRFGDDLDEYDPATGRARVRMERGFGPVEGDDAPLVIGDLALAPDAGSATALVAHGEVSAGALARVLGCLEAAGVEVDAAAVGSDTLWVVVHGRDGPDALRVVEDALSP
ncbi:MAG: hypothetical protein V5A43_06735 [Haloarculaceae archaeon]